MSHLNNCYIPTSNPNMALNLDKNKTELISTWKEILDEKGTSNWALFGYDGPTYDLIVVEKGDGGLEELSHEFNSAKIQYALIRVHLPQKNISKIVLINWQGEGAPLTRKGACANHISTLKDFFSGTHLTLTARNEDEVEPELVLEAVSRAVVGGNEQTTK